MNKKTLVFDFDGVINSYSSGWIDHVTIPDPPVEDAFDFLASCISVYTTVIHTSRLSDITCQNDAFNAIVAWFHKHDFPSQFSILDYEQTLDDPRLLETPALWIAKRKPPAWLTIDDRAFLFRGKFPTHEEIDSFTPWYKQL